MDRSFKHEAVNYGPMDVVSFYPRFPQLDQSSQFGKKSSELQTVRSLTFYDWVHMTNGFYLTNIFHTLVLFARSQCRHSNPLRNKQRFRIILFFPSIIFYAFVHFILFYILWNWCLIVSEFIVYLDDFEGGYPAYVYVCNIVNGLACIWISVYMFEMFRVTVAGTYGTWYWTENKREVPRFTVLRFIYISTRLYTS
ncbi:unnamed protein product [Trichogramma brassicae]|uniref:Choline transporter-like protein n=1 Tax=Trichogramma brassicae TaxID=86971 RepID=A0A6H5INV8_9HYME|nr:unnamed protein product [Trichogramma brassicae]